MERKKTAAAELRPELGRLGSHLSSSPAMSPDEHAIKLTGHLFSFGSSILNRAGEFTSELIIC
ncbi:hypothetical protein E2562_026180 [Oryza meyeriana var. granulata]|uniref:Uncharacterized protein n=1 Tax=Oryza meyeriana var. granulata TaxID=110450 RepID=A0A6G1E273_9ORYZ|nr:hypothetical protein E2562_026180 [Oryza meyeriana var. granulata]